MKYTESSKLNDKEFVDYFEEKVKKTIKDFKLFNKKDKILIAASGGKDSTALLYLMKKLGYNVSAITVNSHIGCYSDENLTKLKKFCSDQKIKLNIISLRKEFGSSLCYIISVLESKGIKKTSCSVCGSLRRYLLNKYSKKLKADVLLTGHNLDDETNGALVSLFSGNLKHVARIGPLIVNKGFIQKAKPFYFVFEDEVERYSKLNKFDVRYGLCPCSSSGARRFYSELNISNEKKFNLINNILKNIPRLKKHYKSEGVKRCMNCKEPSSNSLCQTCKILSIVKDKQII